MFAHLKIDARCSQMKRRFHMFNENESNEAKWLEVYLNATTGTETEKIARKKLTEFGYFERKEAKKDLDHERALILAKTAETEKNWHEVWLLSKSGTDISRIAKEKEKELSEKRRSSQENENHAKAVKLAEKLLG